MSQADIEARKVTLISEKLLLTKCFSAQVPLSKIFF